MKAYFSQFGRVLHLKLSRNKQTGASKHYAFIEFQSKEVADIVARTMNNYLLFGHILKCHLLPSEQVHEDLFKGIGQRFKVDPRNKKAGLQMERGVGREQWEKRVEKENKKRQIRSKTLKEEFGYEFEAPPVKSVDSVPKQLENGDDVQPQLTEVSMEEAPAQAVEAPKAKKGKKAAKSAAIDAPAVETTQPDEPAQPIVPAKKGKKAAKSAPIEAPSTEAVAPAEEPQPIALPTKKAKGKKATKPTSITDESPLVLPEPVDTPAKKAKKTINSTSAIDVEADLQAEIAASATPAKKNKKRKSDVVETTTTTTTTVVEVPAAELTPKTKKARKEKPAAVVEEVVVEKAVKPKQGRKAKA